MKVSAGIALLALLSITLTGCGSGSEGGQQSGSTPISNPFDFLSPEWAEVSQNQLDPFPGVAPATTSDDPNSPSGFEPFQASNPLGDMSSSGQLPSTTGAPPFTNEGNLPQLGSGGSTAPTNTGTPDWMDEGGAQGNPNTGTLDWMDRGGNTGSSTPPWEQNTSSYFPGRGGASDLIYLGITVFNLVQANQPQVSAETQRISVLPPVAPENWEKMSGWTGPHVRTFALTSKNRAGSTVVSFQYKVIYYANGNHLGKGAYIANLQVVPEVVDVGWGFKFDARFEMGDIINVGTPENPVAGVHFQLHWRLHSAMKRLQGIDSYFLSGDSELNLID